MKRYPFLCVLGIVIAFFSCKLNFCAVRKLVSVTVIEDIINGVTFTHRIDYLDGAAKELWAINGVATSANEFEQQIHEQERIERSKERSQQAERVRAQMQFHDEFQRMCQLKIIRKLMQEIRSLIHAIENPRLQPFIVYAQHTVASSKDFQERIRSVLQEEAHFTANNAQLTNIQIQEFLTRLEPMPEQLQQLYQQTLKNACNQSDDTALLKELLQLSARVA